jgi:N-dimethylarginine dimethylaminohydrolase
VVSLELCDPRYYHLDTAVAVLDATTLAWLPEAFTPRSRAVLRERFPDAVVADPADAAVLGLNAVSDGRHVVLPAQASRLAARLRERGFVPVPVDLSELRKGGGGPKCCTLEVRP